MTYAIIGTGAIGGFYGARLAQSGKEVHFLLHSDYEFVRQHGLQVNSCEGNFHLPRPLIYNHVSAMPQVDVVIVALKSTNNHLLPQLLPPLLKPTTLVLLIQNGIGLEDDLLALMPGLHLAAGLAFICSAKTQPGVINHQFYGSINIGNFNAPTVAPLLADLADAGIKAREVDYLEARWRKAVWNMPFNGMTVALHTQTDRLLANPATERLIEAQMLEVIGAAQALGVTALTPAFAEKMMASTRAMVPYSPSMRLDYDFHRPMEIHYLYSRPIELARAAGFSMPLMQMLEAELRFLEAENLG